MILLLACETSTVSSSGSSSVAPGVVAPDPAEASSPDPLAAGPAVIPDEDAGDVAFVHLAVATILGRPVHGQAELHALVALATDEGREAVLDALYADPGYAAHWARVLLHDTEMSYEAGEVYEEAFAPCVEAPLAEGDPAELAAHLATAPSDQAAPFAFNLQDGLTASIAEDELLGMYRLTLLTRLGWERLSGRRGWLLNNTFIRRPEQCVACHNSTWSAADAGLDPSLESFGWDRSWPTGLNLDGDLVGGDRTLPLVDGQLECADRGCDVYAARCASCHGQDAATPVASGGVSDAPSYRAKVLQDRIPELTEDQIAGTALDGIGRMPSVLDRATEEADATAVAGWLQQRFGRRDDLETFVDDFVGGDYTAGAVRPFGIDPVCGVAIASARVERTPRTFAGHTTQDPTPFDLADALVTGQIALRNAHTVDTNAESDVSLADRRIGGAASFTWIAAEAFVDNVVEEVRGAALSTNNGIPRNRAQSERRAELTKLFLESEWSLQLLLTELLLDPLANRRAPAESTLDVGYPLPMLVNPWADTHQAPNPRTGEGMNGVGDLVHRYTPDHAQWAAAAALGWPAPSLAPDPSTGGWNTSAFQSALGALTDPLHRGEEVWTTQSLLAWESVVGGCNADGSLGVDWVDHALDVPGVTLEVVLVATRDRILGDPRLADVERAALPPLDRAVTPEDEALVRAWCGALLTSPDFLLAGLAPSTELDELPTLQVGLPGEPGTVEEWAAHYAGALEQ